MFKGDDHREFWVRAEERNSNTAKDYKTNYEQLQKTTKKLQKDYKKLQQS